MKVWFTTGFYSTGVGKRAGEIFGTGNLWTFSCVEWKQKGYEECSIGSYWFSLYFPSSNPFGRNT